MLQFEHTPLQCTEIVLSPMIKVAILSIIKSLVYEKLKYREEIKLCRWVAEIVFHTLQQ